jgi:hypothetical protein
VETVSPPRVHPSWIQAKLERLTALVQTNPIRARAELREHLDGELVLSPVPSEPHERRAVVVGRVKSDSLLAEEEAVCLQVVAGAGFEPATFGL